LYIKIKVRNNSFMRKNVYIILKENIISESCEIKISDIADVYCNDVKIAKEIKELSILQFNKIPNRAVIPVTEIIQIIEDYSDNVSVANLGGTSAIVQYKKKKKQGNIFVEFFKVAIICLIVFFGAAFAIMSFNEDVSTSSLFENVYELITGNKSDGKTLIEASYSIGLGFGIIILYGHFWKMRITDDPSPIEVEMSKYEKDINSTIVSNSYKEED